MPPPIDLIDQPADLAPALDRIRDDIIGVDVERADADLYYRRAALVQIGDADRCVLLDPLAIPAPTALGELCADRLVVLHALENDLTPMESLGVTMPHLADSAIAAAMLGLPTGLGPLLSEVLDIELTGNKSKYQRADWSRRPLTQGMMEYAAGDVFFLPDLWRALQHRLDEAGRTAWYEQELAATIAGTRVDSRHWDKVKGSGRLEPQQRAVLRALWEEREAICREHDIAPNRLVHDTTLLDLATDPARDPEQLRRRDPQRRRGPVRHHVERLFEAQERGLSGDPEPRPASRRWTDGQRNAYDAMRKRRTQIAEEVGVEAGILCPSRNLHDAVTADPDTSEAMIEAAGWRPWQTELLVDELWNEFLDAIEAAEARERD